MAGRIQQPNSLASDAQGHPVNFLASPDLHSFPGSKAGTCECQRQPERSSVRLYLMAELMRSKRRCAPGVAQQNNAHALPGHMRPSHSANFLLQNSCSLKSNPLSAQAEPEQEICQVVQALLGLLVLQVGLSRAQQHGSIHGSA